MDPTFSKNMRPPDPKGAVTVSANQTLPNTLDTTTSASDLAHARLGSSGEHTLESPSMFLAGTKARPATGQLAVSPSTTAPHSSPIQCAHDKNRSGGQGESMAACAGGMCPANVEWRPLRPRSPPCPAAAPPPDVTVTRESESPTSTCVPIRRKGGAAYVVDGHVVVWGDLAAAPLTHLIALRGQRLHVRALLRLADRVARALLRRERVSVQPARPLEAEVVGHPPQREGCCLVGARRPSLGEVDCGLLHRIVTRASDPGRDDRRP